MRFLYNDGIAYQNLVWGQSTDTPDPTDINVLESTYISSVYDPRLVSVKTESRQINFPSGNYGISGSIIPARFSKLVGLREMFSSGFPYRTYTDTNHMFYDDRCEIPTFGYALRYAPKLNFMSDKDTRSLYRVPFRSEGTSSSPNIAPLFTVSISQVSATSVYKYNTYELNSSKLYDDNTGIFNTSSMDNNSGSMVFNFKAYNTFAFGGVRKLTETELVTAPVPMQAYYYVQGSGQHPNLWATTYKYFTVLDGQVQKVDPIVSGDTISFAQGNSSITFM